MPSDLIIVFNGHLLAFSSTTNRKKDIGESVLVGAGFCRKDGIKNKDYRRKIGKEDGEKWNQTRAVLRITRLCNHWAGT